MKAVVSIGARFTAVLKLAEYLDRAGYLERLITFTPKRRLKDLLVMESRMTNLALSEESTTRRGIWVRRRNSRRFDGLRMSLTGR